MNAVTLDYRLLPIAVAAVSSSFEEEELNEDSLLRDILHGRISLEERLEGIPKFSFEPNKKSNSYSGASLEEIKAALKNGKKEVEIEITQSWLSRIIYAIKSSLEGVFYDKREEVVVHEELSLEQKRDQALSQLQQAREQEKKSKVELERTRGSLSSYLNDLSLRYRKDSQTFPKLARFATKLQGEIDELQQALESGDLSDTVIENYQEQVNRGQDYFSRLVNQISYLKVEMGLIDNSKNKYSQMQIRMDSLIDRKESKLRESLVKIKEAEMTRDLSSVIEAADCLIDLETDTREISSFNDEIHGLIDAAFDAVDQSMQSNGQLAPNNIGEYRANTYRSKVDELNVLLVP